MIRSCGRTSCNSLLAASLCQTTANAFWFPPWTSGSIDGPDGYSLPWEGAASTYCSGVAESKICGKDSHIHLLEHLDGSELTSYTGHTNKPFGFDDLGVEAAVGPDVHSTSWSMLPRIPKTHRIASRSYCSVCISIISMCNMRQRWVVYSLRRVKVQSALDPTDSFIASGSEDPED